MDPVTTYGVASIMGMLGGLGHQLYDPYKKNELYAIARSVVIGIIAAILMAASIPVNNVDVLIAQSIIYGWFGDNVVLNFIRRRNGKNNGGDNNE